MSTIRSIYNSPSHFLPTPMEAAIPPEPPTEAREIGWQQRKPSSHSVPNFLDRTVLGYNGARHIDLGECTDGLNQEVTGCVRGGDSTYRNWRFS
ncbi:hypothetical protein CROQUDRAFT_100657 [Cronartium quercuum f. sp. fusiforme G11]|uniref:Uncharacterized protein n=1 Tax=Cronartium quercuum f. sp. fusiforme G11 TaxID=708437 RepID=A0A9P6NA69_9BASI|nr:hypothetical protein CROQUDRAFT_100657 [Cronartium quercuum f. sp. fusiforme G11]